MNADLKVGRHRAEFVIALGLKLGLQRIDLIDHRAQLVQFFFVGVAGNGVIQFSKHSTSFGITPGAECCTCLQRFSRCTNCRTRASGSTQQSLRIIVALAYRCMHKDKR